MFKGADGPLNLMDATSYALCAKKEKYCRSPPVRLDLQMEKEGLAGFSDPSHVVARSSHAELALAHLAACSSIRNDLPMRKVHHSISESQHFFLHRT